VRGRFNALLSAPVGVGITEDPDDVDCHLLTFEVTARTAAI
jgi:hypothetical protein